MPDVSIAAVDWSGRRAGAAESIWLARTDVDGRLVDLESGRDRDAVVDRLVELAAHPPRLVIGLDFAFGFPAWWSRQRGWRRGLDIWQEMRTTAEDVLAACDPPFWGRPQRPNPNTVAKGLRLTDHPSGGAGRAKSVFQIGGAGAVGTGSLRGMAQLHRLTEDGFVVWPFEDDDGTSPLVIEIYPRRLTGPINKSSWRARHEYLFAKHADQPETMLERAAGTEDAFDAAVSAIAMSRHRDRLTRLPPITDPTVRLEGRIWAPSG